MVALLACDWGTTNLRAWALDEAGQVLASIELPLGVSKMPPGAAAEIFARDVRPTLAAEDAPALLCGMVGSNLGWAATAYLDCPVTSEDLAGAVMPAPGAPGVGIVPGVRCDGFGGQGDVMRGEETQLFGWLAANPQAAKGRRLICHPGTHAKWMVLEEGRLSTFVTSMTGELFALLKRHSVLRSDAPADDMQAFDEGVASSGDGDALAARLFTARARVVGRGRPSHTTPSYISGLLIGAEVAATPRLLGYEDTTEVVLLGDVELCGLYARALDARGVRTATFDGEAAAISGLWALHCEGRAA